MCTCLVSVWRMGMASEQWSEMCVTWSFSLWCGPYVRQCTSPATHLTRLNTCRGIIGWKNHGGLTKTLTPDHLMCSPRSKGIHLQPPGFPFYQSFSKNASLYVLARHVFQTMFNPNCVMIRKPCLTLIIHEPHVWDRLTMVTTECFTPSSAALAIEVWIFSRVSQFPTQLFSLENCSDRHHLLIFRNRENYFYQRGF